MFEINKNVFGILSDAISEAIIVVDESQTIVATNSSALSIFGYLKEELHQEKLSIIIPKAYHSNHKNHFKKYYENSVKRKMGMGKQLYGLKKDGAIFPLEVGLSPFTVNNEKFVMAIVIDITYRKNVEKEIYELNNQLEKKVKLRTLELDETINKLQNLNEQMEVEINRRIKAETKIKYALKKEKELGELKTKFLSLVSHEFKTPLTGILTSATLLGKYPEKEQQSKREKHINTIKNKVYNLNGIIDDFLSIERIDSGKVNYKFTNFNVSKIVNEVLYDANMVLKSGQKINYPIDIDEYSIYQDEKIVELILFNLVRNAVKYSPENTIIDFEVDLNTEKIIFKVSDHGIGIPKEDQKFIFQRYFRAENVLNEQGTGIGLNIVKNHVDNLGGNISFISEENVGSTFTVELPIVN